MAVLGVAGIVLGLRGVVGTGVGAASAVLRPSARGTIAVTWVSGPKT